MKPRNREIYKGLPEPSDEFRVVSRERLPQKSAYRISFIDICNGVLRPRLYNLDQNPFLSFPEWAERYSTFPKEEKGVDLLYASEEGLALIEQLGYSWFREDVFSPEQWGGEKRGEGSESIVYKANLAGKSCVIKHINTAGIQKLNEYAWRQHYNTPEYLKKFMITSQVSKIVAAVQQENAFDSFVIVDSPREYLASKYFIIEEYVEGSTLKDIEDQVSSASEPIINGREQEFWREWFPRFEKDQNSLEELFFLTGLEREEPFTKTDFYNSNWIFKGFSPAGKVQLSLIDQATAGVASDISLYNDEEQQEKKRQKELLHKWHDSPVLELLRQYKL